jgi:hypothetical protein
LAQDMDKWWAFVSTVVILRVPWRACNFLTEWLLFSEEVFCSMQLVSQSVSQSVSGCHSIWNSVSTLDIFVCVCVCARARVYKEIVGETRLPAGRPGFGFRQSGDVYYLRRRVRDGCGVHLSVGSYPAVRAAGREAGRPPPSGAGTGNAWSCASSPRFFMALFN